MLAMHVIHKETISTCFNEATTCHLHLV